MLNRGTKAISQGIYINLNKNGSKFNHRNQIFINVDEEKREVSISSILYRLGFDVPKDVVLYANRADIVSNDPTNAYTLASIGMRGEQIYELCQELNEQGSNLKKASLSDEQIARYGVEPHRRNIEERLQKCFNSIQYKKIGNKIVGIYDGTDPMGAYFAYNNGADFVISVSDYIKDDIKKGVIFAIQSDPKKGDLPLDVIQWALKIKRQELLEGSTAKSNTGFKNIDDMLIKSTRIICGGNMRPDLYLEDRRDDKQEDFKQVVLQQVLTQIAKSETRNLGLDYTELSCQSADIKSMIETLNVRAEEEAQII